MEKGSVGGRLFLSRVAGSIDDGDELRWYLEVAWRDGD